MSATTRAFYLLQNAGIKYPNVNANAVIEIYRAAVQCISEFGCASIYINKGNTSILDKLQGKLIKQITSLSQWCHTRPLLEAVKIMPTSTQVLINGLDILKQCVFSNSIAQDFYCKLLSHGCDKRTLVGRSVKFASDNNFDLHRYIFDDTYTKVIKSKLYGKYIVKHGKDGLIDTIRHLLSNCDNDNRRFLELLLKAF